MPAAAMPPLSSPPTPGSEPRPRETSRRASARDRLRSLTSPFTLNVRSGICGLPRADLEPSREPRRRLGRTHREYALCRVAEWETLEVEHEVDDRLRPAW